MRSLLGVLLLAVLSVATEKVRPVDHGVGRLRSLLKKFHKDFDQPIDTHMQMMDDKTYNQKIERQKYIQSFVIE